MTELKREYLRKKRRADPNNASSHKWLICIIIGILAQILILWGSTQYQFNGALIFILAFGDVVLAMGIIDYQTKRTKNKKAK